MLMVMHLPRSVFIADWENDAHTHTLPFSLMMIDSSRSIQVVEEVDTLWTLRITIDGEADLNKN